MSYTLTNYLGGTTECGGKIKTTTDWKYDAGGNATNESGFSALPPDIASSSLVRTKTLAHTPTFGRVRPTEARTRRVGTGFSTTTTVSATAISTTLWTV